MTNFRAGKSDKRGNNVDRKSRKQWMLSVDKFGGDGHTVFCVHGCGTLLNFETVEADRIQPGGSYARHNVQPSCRSCNIKRSNNPDWTYSTS